MTNDSTKKYKVQVAKKVNIRHGAIVDLTRYGDKFAEVLWMDKKPVPGIIRLDKDRYQVIKTGEIRYFRQNEGKIIDSMKKVFKDLDGLIKTNFPVKNMQNALFITLTYDTERPTTGDEEIILQDFKIFMQKLRRHKKGHKLEYITVIEPQEDGTWHLHALLKSDQPILYIDNKEMTKYKLNDDGTHFKDPETGRSVILGGLWGHGYTTTEKIKGNDPGKYFSQYFKTLEADCKHDKGIVKGRNGKKYEKGSRLHYYPKGIRVYRCSQGIKRPADEMALYGDVVHEFGKPGKYTSYEIVEERDIFSADAFSKVVNTIQREEFRKKSKKACKDGENIVQ
jgi:hypothetical protein